MATASSLTATALVNEDVAWITERACRQKCVWIDSGLIGAPYPDIVMHLNCGSPYLNACFCRSALGVSATEFLSSCVSSRCESDGINDYGTELFSALSIYSRYCSTAAGVGFAAPSITLTSAGSISVSTSSASVRTTSILTASSTSSSDNSNSQTSISVAPARTSSQVAPMASSSSGLSFSTEINLAVGLRVGILAIFLGVVAFIWHKRRKRGQQNSHRQTQHVPTDINQHASDYTSPVENKYTTGAIYSTKSSELGDYQHPRHELDAYQHQRPELSS